MKRENSIHISRLLDTVFAFGTNPDGGTKRQVSDGPVDKGLTYRLTGNFLFLRFDGISEVTA